MTLWVRIAIVPVLLVTGFLQLRAHDGFADEAGDLVEVCEALPPGQRILGLTGTGPSAALQPMYARDGWAPFSPYAHAPSVCMIERGGRSPTMTFDPSLSWIPLGLVPDEDLDGIGIADVFDGMRLASELDVRAGRYDYLLVSSDSEPMHRAADRHGDLVRRRGHFGLYRVVRGSAGSPEVESSP